MLRDEVLREAKAVLGVSSEAQLQAYFQRIGRGIDFKDTNSWERAREFFRENRMSKGDRARQDRGDQFR